MNKKYYMDIKNVDVQELLSQLKEAPIEHLELVKVGIDFELTRRKLASYEA